MANNEQIVELPSGEQRRLRAVLPRSPRQLSSIGSQQQRPSVESLAGREEEPEFRPESVGDQFGNALQLVRSASDALERMRARYHEIEAYSTQQAEYYRAELSAVNATMRELQEQNLAREEIVQRLEAQVRAEIEQRRGVEETLRSVSESAQSLRDQYDHVEARASNAEAWLARFQGEIATAFGEIPRILGEINQEAEAAAQNDFRRAAGGY